MRKKILIGAALVLVGFAGFVASRPSTFQVTRQTLISASPAVIFEQVNDFHRWETWSPWAKMDPSAKNTFEGPASGVGSSFAWDGNNQVGSGKMTITESRPAEYVGIKLEFFKPFKGLSTTEFTLKAQGSQTLVAWSMSGKNGFMGKLMGLVMNCETMIGGQYEKGLTSLKKISEN